MEVDDNHAKQIKSLNEAFVSGSSKKLKQTLDVFHDIVPLLETEHASNIQVACTAREGIDTNTNKAIAELSSKSFQLLNKLEHLSNCRNLARDACAMNDAVSERIKALFINEDDCAFLNEESKRPLEPIITSCKQFEEKLGELNELGEKQRRLFEKAVQGREAEFNRFLKDAGCPYTVKISREVGSNVILVPIVKDSPAHTITVNDPLSTLSQGEKNTIALALFVYTTIYSEEDYDLVVLDDPISSFDAGKRNAILRTFFVDPSSGEGPNVERNLFGTTTLVLTHDFPVLMAVILMQNDLGDPRAHYLWRNNKDDLKEAKIEFKRDFASQKGLQYFENLQLSKARNGDKPLLTRLIAARRLLEVQGYGQVQKHGECSSDKNIASNILSCLLHKRNKPYIRGSENQKLDIEGFPNRQPESDFDKAAAIIEEILDYKQGTLPSYQELHELTNTESLLSAYNDEMVSNYDRLQICRVALDGTDAAKREPILHSLLDESMHVSGDYLYQLDPDKYEIVAPGAIAWCTQEMKRLEIEGHNSEGDALEQSIAKQKLEAGDNHNKSNSPEQRTKNQN